MTVVARSFGIATANNAGTGPAQATIGNVNAGVSLVRFTHGTLGFNGLNWTLAPAHPGDTLVLWGTGGGADPLNDTGGSSGDQTAAGNFSVIVKGTSITPLFAGASSGYPGLWQINFTLPLSIPTGCFAPLQVSAGGNLSNQVTIAIAPAGQRACSTAGFSNSGLSKLGSGGNIIDAVLSVNIGTSRVNGTTTNTEAVGGFFENYSAAEFLPPFAGPVVGACHMFSENFPFGGKVPNTPDAHLDAGTLTVSGPGIPAQTVGMIAIPGTVVLGGTYTITATGGADIAAFSVTQTMPPSFAVTNLPALSVVNRSQPTTVNWTGGGSGSVVIVVQTLKYDSTLTNAFESFVACTVPATAGTFTIPTAALTYLPAVALGGSDIASVSVAAGQTISAAVSGVSTAAQQFTPNLTAGGMADFGLFTGGISVNQSIAVQ